MAPNVTTLQNPDNWDKFHINNHRAEYIYLKWQNKWNLWTSIEKSALITEGDGRPVDYGKGLFAQRTFQKNDPIGYYSGEKVWLDEKEKRRRAKAAAGAKNRCKKCRYKPADCACYILEYIDESNGFSAKHVDGRTGNTGYLQYVNDPKGTTSTPNAIMKDNGVLVANESIKPNQEILFSYKNDYWK